MMHAQTQYRYPHGASPCRPPMVPTGIPYAPCAAPLHGFGADAATPTASETAAKAALSTLSSPVWMVIRTASMAASAYHGYRRNNSVGWALWWGFMGTLFPVITPVIAVAEGFGKPIKKG
jgi:hypothetical protein